MINVKVDFVEKRTKYDAIYANAKGVDEYLIFRAPHERNLKAGDEVNVYLPLDKISIYDEEGDFLTSREQIFKNKARATLKTDKSGKRVLTINGGETLIYDKLDYQDGEYDFILLQDKCQIVYNKKIAKDLGTKPYKPNKGTTLSVSCYDEEPTGKKNTIFAQIKGFEEYVTLRWENNFSVYKMPKFKIIVPNDAFILE